MCDTLWVANTVVTVVIQISMNVKLIMEDVHKHVITLMDLISVPVGMDMS